MNSFSKNIYSTETTILKSKFRKYIMHYIHSQSQSQSQSHLNQINNPRNTRFFRDWKTKINSEYKQNNDISILTLLLDLLVSPILYSKLSTIEYYINQLNYNNHIVEEFVNDFLVYYSIYIY
jgi:hypothetical protein